ncbi:MAG TPA: hypothetical protein VFH83_08675 [Spirochaetia bacterium]|nr:hypothetical protein [Spirochaetia bacterium]
METRLAQFTRGLYFDLQSIEGVQPLEIWNGVREQQDPFERAGVIKNLYKIVVPLVNERCYGQPLSVHGEVASRTVSALLADYLDGSGLALFERFPYPPTGSEDKKALYLQVKGRAAGVVAAADLPERPPQSRARVRRGGIEPRPRGGVEPRPGDAPQPVDGIVPDSLFDFREMRLADNEFPYIIFTDKEFRVIHGLAVVYLWLIDLDSRFLQTLRNGPGTEEIVEAYRKFAARVQRENPLAIHGKRMNREQLLQHVHEKMRYDDYLDVFEEVYRWLEETQQKLQAG